MDDFKREVGLLAEEFFNNFKGYGRGKTSASDMLDRLKREQKVAEDFTKIYNEKAREYYSKSDFNKEELTNLLEITIRDLIVKCHKKR